MNINTNQIVTIAGANYNFFRVTHIVDETVEVIILKKDKLEYHLVDIENNVTSGEIF